MSKVFVSHSHSDEALYSSLCLALDGASIDRWNVDDLVGGQLLGQKLQEAIAQSSVCLFLATEASVASNWCAAEVGAFWGAGKPVVVFLADNKVAEDTLPPQFKGQLYVKTAEKVIQSIRVHLATFDPSSFSASVREGQIFSVVSSEPIEPEWGGEVEELLQKARAAAKQEAFEQALEYASSAAEIAPDCARAHGNRATALVHLRRYDEADAIYDHICSHFSEDAKLVARSLHNKAWLHINRYGLSDVEVIRKCRDLYLQSLAIDNHRLITRAMTLICYCLLGQNDEAEIFLRSSVRWDGFVDSLKGQLEKLGKPGLKALQGLPEWLTDILYPSRSSSVDLNDE